jgi:hypothetical protein
MTHGFTTAFAYSAAVFALAAVVVATLIKARTSDLAPPAPSAEPEERLELAFA